MIHIPACRRITFRIAVTIALFAVLFLPASHAQAVSSGFGNRVWDASKGMPSTFTWNSFSFSGFYYDLDNNLTTEELTINNIQRTLTEKDISYKTSPLEVNFDYSPFGSYQVIGFMAEKYFAGYTGNSIISGKREISTIGSGQLNKVLLDDGNQRVVYVGASLTLKEGYVIRIREVNVGGGPGQVWIVLLKDGSEVDSSVIAGGDTYIYSKRVGTVSDLPVIAVHIDSVFRGTEVNAAFVKGIFQVSDTYTRVQSGDRYGIMEITAVNRNQIRMQSMDSVDLSPGNTIDLMGNLKIIVADNNSALRFALSVDTTGTFEVRGTVYPVVSKWTPLNFGLNIGGGTSVGFYYDMDNDIGTEDLTVNQVSGTSITERNLIYSTSPQEIGFGYSPFGSYQVIGFMADRYFAGYTGNSIISGGSGMSTIGSGQLSRVLLDDDNQRVVYVGASLTLKEGYVLYIKEVDVGAAPGQVWVTLLKDGAEVDSSVVAGGDTYIYSKRVGTVSDLPIIAVHFASVFRGTEVNAAFTRGIFQISESGTTVKSGDVYGQMEVRSVSAGGIKMDNPDSIDLSRGSTVDLMGNIKFKVADSSEVRFYPFVMVTPEMVAEQLRIDAPARATAGDVIEIKVTAGGNAVEGASVAIDSVAGQTNNKGVIDISLNRSMKGVYNITATKLGYEGASKAIEVREFVENKLSIDAPIRANQFQAITISVTYNGTPINEASVSFDNTTIGRTGARGTLNYTPEISGTHTITASKSGYITVSRDIEVRVPFSDFEALNINVTPVPVFTGDNIAVRSNITNAGTKTDTLPVSLIINRTEIDNRTVTLAPGEIKKIEFSYKVTLPAGNYTVEILSQKGSLEVREKAGVPVQEKPVNILLIITVIIVIGVVIIYFLVPKKPKKQEG